MDIRWRNFIWDAEKERRVISQRGITFKEAALTTRDPHAMSGVDTAHSGVEERRWVLGTSPKNRVLLVIVTERGNDLLRIVTARKATPKESEDYEQEII